MLIAHRPSAPSALGRPPKRPIKPTATSNLHDRTSNDGHTIQCVLLEDVEVPERHVHDPGAEPPRDGERRRAALAQLNSLQPCLARLDLGLQLRQERFIVGFRCLQRGLGETSEFDSRRRGEPEPRCEVGARR